MSQKQPKPTLTGQRIRTRKRDEKHHKFDPQKFRDEIVNGINETSGSIEEISKFLDQAGHKLEYNRYGEPLFDILFAGGILAAGGSVEDDGAGVTQHCVFQQESEERLREFVVIFEKLTRRYKYLLTILNEHVKKLLKFLTVFSTPSKNNFALTLGFIFGSPSNMVSPTVLESLFADHLTKDEESINFLVVVFKGWLATSNMANIGSALRKSGMSERLLDFLPENKRKFENFVTYFESEDLQSLADFYRQKLMTNNKAELQTKLSEMFSQKESSGAVLEVVSSHVKELGIPEDEVITILWRCLMHSFEWNKKPDILQAQALQHIMNNCSLLAKFTRSTRAQLDLLHEIQSFCYDNFDFMKIVQKIVLLLYNSDVLDELAVRKWCKDGHTSKGWSVIDKQMQPMLEWLDKAEEESDEE